MKNLKRTIKCSGLMLLMSVFLFIMSSTVMAGGGVNLSNIVKGVKSDNTLVFGSVLTVSAADLDLKMSGFMKEYRSGAASVYWIVNDKRVKSKFNGTSFYVEVDQPAGSTYSLLTEDKTDTSYSNNSEEFTVYASIDITIDAKGTATVTGKSIGAPFERLAADNGYYLDYSINGKTSFKVTFDTKKLELGYHKLYTTMIGNYDQIVYPKMFPVVIYDVPSISAGSFETYPNYLSFKSPYYNTVKYSYYLQVKKAADSWDKARLYGPIGAANKVNIDNLVPDTKYNVRAYYIKTVSGQTFAGKPSGEVTIKTGPRNKPAIKSIKISKAKTKKVWVKPLYRGLVLLKKGFWANETTYTVTVTFKKKPGVSGIYIKGTPDSPLYTYVKGNKKTYKAKFTVGGKKGQKINVSVYTKTNGAFTMYSPVYSKRVKVK